MNNKKTSEVGLVKEALIRLGLSARSVCPCDPPFPDVLVTLEDGRLIGVEVSDYYSDAGRGTSSHNRAFASNWMQVQAEIRHHVKRHAHLRHITGWLKPQHERMLCSGANAEALGRELVDFAARARVDCKAGPSTHCAPFPDQYCLMNKYVAELTLRPTGAVQWVSWNCAGMAGGFGLDERRVRDLIGNKEQKSYDWGGAEERWLLITAGAAPATVASWVGPEWQEGAKLESLDLSWITAFHRVLFLALSPSCWAREIWRAPGLAALQSQSRL